MTKLSNSKAELKKSVAYKKKRVLCSKNMREKYKWNAENFKRQSNIKGERKTFLKTVNLLVVQ